MNYLKKLINVIAGIIFLCCLGTASGSEINWLLFIPTFLISGAITLHNAVEMEKKNV